VVEAEGDETAATIAATPLRGLDHAGWPSIEKNVQGWSNSMARTMQGARCFMSRGARYESEDARWPECSVSLSRSGNSLFERR
jgi:hypothetical protein